MPSMKNIYILFFLFAFLAIESGAQTLGQAKVFYQKQEYEKAKPVFKRFVKSQPGNGNYNLWYGVCCLKTGEPDVALKHLETAVKKRIPSGQLYLAQTYSALYRYEDAIETFEIYISELKKRKRSTEEAEALLEQTKALFRMLKGVEQVCVIDSFVVDKASFLSAYKISPESGQIYPYNQYFDREETGNDTGTVYETELGNRIYYSELQDNGKHQILLSNKLMEDWSSGVLLPDNINGNRNAGYPFVMTDGMTIYYAADGEDSMGGWDIFVTRYNPNTDSYLMPENLGMPFNSTANDYLYVIDEFNNLGWFASDRNQPEEKVCIYVFIPNTSKQVYDYENIDTAKLIQLATLSPISSTWAEADVVEEAQKRLKAAINRKMVVEEQCDFCFVIDDTHTYHAINDFRKPQAKALFEKYQQQEKALKVQKAKLENLREHYVRATEREKSELTPAIIDLEKQVQQLSRAVEKSAIEVRRAEKE